jgi:hypothetical protein
VRKVTLELILGPAGPSIRFNEHLHACKLGLEGIVSKRRDSPYNSGLRLRQDRGRCYEDATKYGAFSTPSGSVDVNWEIQGSDSSQILYFQWKEREGPAVTQTSQKGFGSSLIASTVEVELH